MPVMSYCHALQETLRAELRRDERIFLIGEEIGAFGGAYQVTAGLLAEFGPQRIVDTPVAEEGFVGMAIGAAMCGLRPIVEIMTINFTLVAFDQIVNHAAKIHSMFGGQFTVPLVLRTPTGGKQQLAATHAQSLEVLLAHIPGLKVVAPATPADAMGLLRSAIRDDDPVIFVEHMALYATEGDVPGRGDYAIPIGSAHVKREGTDLTLIAYAHTTLLALEAAAYLAREGISAEVIDLRALRPLDTPTIIHSVKKTQRAVIIEEGWRTYGVGAEIAATVQEATFANLAAPVRRVGGIEVPPPYARALEQAMLPNMQRVLDAIYQTLDSTRC